MSDRKKPPFIKRKATEIEGTSPDRRRPKAKDAAPMRRESRLQRALRRRRERNAKLAAMSPEERQAYLAQRRAILEEDEALASGMEGAGAPPAVDPSDPRAPLRTTGSVPPDPAVAAVTERAKGHKFRRRRAKARETRAQESHDLAMTRGRRALTQADRDEAQRRVSLEADIDHFIGQAAELYRRAIYLEHQSVGVFDSLAEGAFGLSIPVATGLFTKDPWAIGGSMLLGSAVSWGVGRSKLIERTRLDAWNLREKANEKMRNADRLHCQLHGFRLPQHRWPMVELPQTQELDIGLFIGQQILNGRS